MRRSAFMKLALGVGVLMVAILALTACGGGVVGGQEQADKPPTLPEDEQALRPGEYRSAEFKPSVSFEVGKGWSTSPPEASDVLQLGRGELGGLAFTDVQEIYKPTETGTPKVMELPKDLVGWFQHHPYLKTSESEPATVGGVKGEQFDVVVEGLPEDHVSQCGTDCVDVFEQRFGHQVILFEGDKVHFIVLEDVKGSTVTIDFGSQATDFEEVVPEAQKLVESVKWGGS